MPAKGKHRRTKARFITTSLAAAGTGGAAIALPLLGATGAHAATPAAAPEHSATSVTAGAHEGAARTYTVKAGDWLARIADEQHVAGGWHKLYDDNRAAVGTDPSLIHPGLKLTLGAKAPAHATGSSAASSSAVHEAPARSGTAEKSATAEKPASAQTGRSAAASSAEPAASSSSGYTLPVQGAVIGTAYHTAGSMWSSGYHTGTDFVVPTGTSVKAIADATVVSAGWGGAYGNQVVLKLADGHYAQYAHLSQLSVSAGQTVTEGQQLGLSGATGNVTGPHLHFEIRTTPNYGSDVDPVAYLRAHGVTVG
ncbi:murein DD-endopeptidase MepM/ murein hydrolase activator NlpD [Streptomyces sp. B3I7]|uniref:M23 family metallopeptidase n=1 Tax=Streptomyces sp. B3I7 TaxID=3042269 RepID=UPI0027812174|nr:LysM peptidoglycan-binding domain-containing M23 family metallopeptidase [Streptomyces sp. B3I7]MDQ0809734.1 murein DD-endopeptidase MepM/ murein hydrolase activator NlpD [Streptomyces sp. B3I7]